MRRLILIGAPTREGTGPKWLAAWLLALLAVGLPATVRAQVSADPRGAGHAVLRGQSPAISDDAVDLSIVAATLEQARQLASRAPGPQYSPSVVSVRLGATGRSRMISQVRPAVAQASMPAARGQNLPAEADWSRVGGLSPGTEVALRTEPNPSLRWDARLAAADADSVTVVRGDRLDGLPNPADDFVKALFESDPAFFGLSGVSRESQSLRVRVVAGDGVFVEGSRVADWTDITTRLESGDVVEVLTPRTWWSKGTGGLVGYFGGVMAGFAIGGRVGSGDGAAANGAFFGGLVGVVAGMTTGARPRVVYRRPTP